VNVFTFAQPDITRLVSQAIKKIIPDYVSKVSGFGNKAIGRNLARAITNSLPERKIDSVLQPYQRAVSAILGEPSQSEIPAELKEHYEYLIFPLYDSTIGKEHGEWQASPPVTLSLIQQNRILLTCLPPFTKFKLEGMLHNVS
jgi:hypothetical protein